MNYLKCAALAVATLLMAPAAGIPAPAAPAPASSALGRDRLWDDGKAEFSRYSGVTNRYGEDRATTARIVIVKEDLLKSALVKSDSGPVPGATFEVLKIVFVAEFNTGSYFYRQAATTFVERATLDPVKETASSFDGCGLTFVRVGPKAGKLVHEAHSYWEGEADREVSIGWPADPAPRVFADALPLWLRGALASGRVPARVWLLPGQIGGRSPIENTRPVEAALAMSDAGTIAVPAGKFVAKRVDVAVGKNVDRIWFAAAYPHVLLKLETAAGRTLVLEKTQRLDYWNHHAEGDEQLIE